jgi:hypothetical protein
MAILREIYPKGEMKSMRIDDYSFGSLVINGKPYTSDLIIYPDGKIEEHWRRKRGHELCLDDIHGLIESAPDVIIAGTGVSGRVTSDEDFQKGLSALAIEFISAPNEKAIETFNELSPKKRVGACFHLTC